MRPQELFVFLRNISNQNFESNSIILFILFKVYVNVNFYISSYSNRKNIFFKTQRYLQNFEDMFNFNTTFHKGGNLC